MRMADPIFFETVADAPIVAIPTNAVEQSLEEGTRALDDAEKVTTKAFEFEMKAREALIRIRAHNEEWAGKFWGKPNGWRNMNTGNLRYSGYTAVDEDGDYVPHGEGEHWFPSGNYECAEYYMLYQKGFMFRRFASGIERAGYFDGRTNSGYLVDRSQNGMITAGEVAKGTHGHLYCLKLGMIQYPNSGRYWGYCGYSEETEYWVPSGFGVWDSGRSFACYGFFDNGFGEGEVMLLSGDTRVGGRLSLGRLIGKSGYPNP